jgi:hypothetical protein
VLVDAVIRLESGLAFWRASWPVDELLKAYLTDLAPDRFDLRQETVYIEVRGARGWPRCRCSA